MANDKNNNGNGTGTENKDQKENILKRAWAKVPGWGKKAIKVAGLAGLALGAYTLGKGSNPEDPAWEPLPEPDDSNVIDMPE